jgi:putative ABC transport system permease protein
LGSFWHDLRYGARLLGRSPGFSVIAILTLALGIGGSTAIFSVVDGVLLRPLSYPHPDQIVRVLAVTSRGNHIPFSDPDFQDLREQTHDLQGLAEYHNDLEPVLGASEPTLVTVAAVSRDFFKVMGVQPYLGAGFPYGELHVGGAPMALISYGFWQRYLGGSRDFRSHHLSIADHLITIVGVMPPGFTFPADAQLWFPRELFPITPYRTGHNWNLVGRLRNGASLQAAQVEVTTIARRLKQQYGEQSDMTDATLVPLREEIVGNTRPALLILLGAVGLLLLVACANVANLLLAKAAGRQRELAVRVALGATRRHLSRQFVAETLLLSVGGAVLGMPIAIWGVQALLALVPGKLPRAEDVGVHPSVLAFAAGIAVVTAVGLGLITAMRAAGSEVQENLRGGERTQTGGASSYRLRMMLMGAQVSVTMVLLVGAGLLGQSFFRLLNVDPGFRTEHIVTMNLMNLWPESPQAKQRLVGMMTDLVTRLRAVPGIDRVGVTSALPLTGRGKNGGYLVLSAPETFTDLAQLSKTYLSLVNDPTRTGHAEYRVASAGYFRVMGIPLLRGRLFDSSDGPDAPQVAVVSDSFARKQWPGQDPLGKLVEFGNMDGDLRPFTIVGVVGDVRDRSLDATALPTLYADYRQRAANNFSLVLQTNRPSIDIVPIARQIERQVQPDLPARFDTMAQVVSSSVADRQFNLLLLGIFALTALILALMGVYGVGSYLVAQRTKEIGIRMALGADAGDVVRMIAGQGLRVILAGVVVGVAGALSVTRVLASLLYGVTASDPYTFIAVALLLVLAGLLACYVPARRAARVDPISALREQ